VKIVRAQPGEYLDRAKELFTEYADSLGIDLWFQHFEDELAELPGQYAPPDGRLLIAFHYQQVAGCVGIRKIAAGVCEMKRLYVRGAFGRRGIGRSLAEAVIDESREMGYSRMRLDTLPWIEEAISLYRSLGFEEIEPYCHNPIEGALFFERVL